MRTPFYLQVFEEWMVDLLDAVRLELGQGVVQFDFGHFEEGDHGFEVVQLFGDVQLRLLAAEGRRVVQGARQVLDAALAARLALHVGADPVQAPAVITSMNEAVFLDFKITENSRTEWNGCWRTERLTSNDNNSKTKRQLLYSYIPFEAILAPLAVEHVGHVLGVEVGQQLLGVGRRCVAQRRYALQIGVDAAEADRFRQPVDAVAQLGAQIAQTGVVLGHQLLQLRQTFVFQRVETTAAALRRRLPVGARTLGTHATSVVLAFRLNTHSKHQRVFNLTSYSMKTYLAASPSSQGQVPYLARKLFTKLRHCSVSNSSVQYI